MGARLVGVEEEFLLLHSDRPELAGRGDEIVVTANAADPEEPFEHELKQAQAELASDPAESIAALRENLERKRREIARICEHRRLRLVASATSPIEGASAITADIRYQEMTKQFGLVAGEQLTCGMHVHVSINSPAEGVRIIDGIAEWLPALLGLSANSPFYKGADTHYASYRNVLWDRWPTAGFTAAFGDPETYKRTRDDLITIGAALDAGMVYFVARLSAQYPTVEIRICDVCAEVEDTVTIAALTRALVEHASVTAPPKRPGVRAEVLRAAAWRAARWGLSDQLVALGSEGRPRLLPAWTLIDILVDRLSPHLNASGDLGLVHDGLTAIQRRGTGADRQRRVYREAGNFGAVVDALTVANE